MAAMGVLEGITGEICLWPLGPKSWKHSTVASGIFYFSLLMKWNFLLLSTNEDDFPPAMIDFQTKLKSAVISSVISTTKNV